MKPTNVDVDFNLVPHHLFVHRQLEEKDKTESQPSDTWGTVISSDPSYPYRMHPIVYCTSHTLTIGIQLPTIQPSAIKLSTNDDSFIFNATTNHAKIPVDRYLSVVESLLGTTYCKASNTTKYSLSLDAARPFKL